MRCYTLVLLAALATPALALEPIPDKLVVLTFDDSVRSHFTVARPLLLKHKFGATFFITEGFDFKTNKKDYMTWEQIAQLHRDGFEIGNHTRDHRSGNSPDTWRAQLEAIDARCREHGIPKPVTLAYPGNKYDLKALKLLRDMGILFARRGTTPELPYPQGQGFAYEPGLDHPLLLPTAGDARPRWKLDDFKRAVAKARHGRIAVLQFHGVPDRAHPWVHVSREMFEQVLQHLADEGCRVIAMRDLARYVNPAVLPSQPMGVVEDRKRLLAAGRSGDNFRKPADDASLRRWLGNMAAHAFTDVEVAAATGMSPREVAGEMKRLAVERPGEPAKRLRVMPYPGGRHPRVGFLDGAIRPQRETKVSVFAPWKNGGYVVVDVPEAIWWDRPDGRELLYLAHTHVDTTWSRQGIDLKKLEWQRRADGTMHVERTLPNGVAFGAEVKPGGDAVRMTLWLRNGSKEKLSGLRVQNCVMLKGAPGFNAPTTDNRVYAAPYAACHDGSGERWVISAWEACQRAWGNATCPCFHSDPKFPDCEPGQTVRLRGWLSFYEGRDVQHEFRRIEATGWRAARLPKAQYDHAALMQVADDDGALHPVRTVADWRRRRGHILTGMQLAMGQLPSVRALPVPSPRVLESVEGDGYARQTIAFDAEPNDAGGPLHAYLYLPRPAWRAQRAGVVALHPTHAIGKGVVDGQSQRPNRAYGKELAQRGYVVDAPDYPSFGASAGYEFGADRYVSGTMKGIFNHVRCVDLLLARPDVDDGRIAAIGHSLGGHNAMFLAAFDERVKVVVSSCGWTPFHDYYGGRIKGWTSDRYMPRLRDVYGLDPDRVPFDFYEVVASFAPRAFFSCSPLHDGNFAVAGVKKAMPEARKVYALHGAEDRLVAAYPDAGHDFPPSTRAAAYAFIDRHLGSN